MPSVVGAPGRAAGAPAFGAPSAAVAYDVNGTCSVDKDKTKKKKESAKPDEGAETPSSGPAVTIAVVSTKVGESRDNLANREKWFGSRSGKR